MEKRAIIAHKSNCQMLKTENLKSSSEKASYLYIREPFSGYFSEKHFRPEVSGQCIQTDEKKKKTTKSANKE